MAAEQLSGTTPPGACCCKRPAAASAPDSWLLLSSRWLSDGSTSAGSVPVRLLLLMSSFVSASVPAGSRHAQQQCSA